MFSSLNMIIRFLEYTKNYNEATIQHLHMKLSTYCKSQRL